MANPTKVQVSKVTNAKGKAIAIGDTPANLDAAHAAYHLGVPLKFVGNVSQTPKYK